MTSFKIAVLGMGLALAPAVFGQQASQTDKAKGVGRSARVAPTQLEMKTHHIVKHAPPTKTKPGTHGPAAQ